MRLVAGVLVGSLLAVGSLAALPHDAAQAAPGDACADLVSTGVCTLTYSDYPDGATFAVPESISAVTMLVAGGTGGNAKGEAALGGTGALIFGELDLGDDRAFTVSLGNDGDGGGQSGWAAGGAEGEGRGAYENGGAGGGATSVLFSSGTLLAVAGGGGGGGGNVSINGETASGGGLGGQGGEYENDGNPGTKLYGANGAGGTGAGNDVAAGQHGGNAGPDWDISTSVGGGGGGGGYGHGGGQGENGKIGVCNSKGKCPKDVFAGAGGGGGAGDSYASSIFNNSLELTAGRGEGSVTIYSGTPSYLACIDSNAPQTFDIPSDAGSYAFVMAGGAGSRGHSANDLQGTGALASGIIDVTGVSSLTYFVGCSAYTFGGAGWGQPGSGGGSTWDTAKDGGDGGGASIILNGDNTDVDVFAAAGGGGGSGGSADCFPSSDDCQYTGGKGGSGAGTAGTHMPYDGGDGSGYFDHATGGCGGCQGSRADPDPDGGNGSGSDSGGGGGGGGAGYPRGGDGGNEKEDGSGGGGGAGESYLGQRVSGGSMVASGSHGDGFIILIPIVKPTTTMAVSKQVTGDGSAFGTGPFTVEVDCSYDGDTLLNTTFQLDAGATHTVEDVPTETVCEITETVTGDATVPPATVVQVVDTSPVAVTLVNRFTLATLSVDLRSQIIDAEGTSFGLGPLAVDVSCTFDGHSIAIDGSDLVFTGELTWSAAVSRTLEVPIGAECTATQVPPPGAPAIAYDPQTVTVAAAGSTVSITDTYTLTSMTVSKGVGGDGTAPSGVDYDLGVACTINGAPVILASSSVSIPADRSATIDRIPADASCTVTETGRQGAVAVQYAPSRTVITGDAPNVAVTNVYEDGGLHVTVSTSGAGASWVNAADIVTVSIECAFGGGPPVFSSAIDVPATGGVISVAPDEGSTCTIAETAVAGATEVDYPLGTSVVIPVGGPASLSVDNRYDIAPLVVTSVNTGPGAQYANVPTAATVDDCTFGGAAHPFSEVVPFGIHGGTAAVSGIVVGAQCDVTQSTAAGGATSYAQTDGDPSSALTGGVRVTVNATGPTTVTITNDFPLGALTVGKVLAGEAAWAANAPYAVAVKCTFNDLPVARLGPDGIAHLEFAADGTLQPGHGATALGTLSVGSECSAAESAGGGATTVTYTPSGNDRSAPVRVPGAITVTNTFDAAALTVAKVLGGNDGAAHAADRFVFDGLCVFNGRPLGAPPTGPDPAAEFDLAGGQDIVFPVLPVGAVCDVFELVDHHATAVRPGGDQRTVLTAAGATLTFTNVFDVAPVTVRQVVTGAGAATYGLPNVFVAEVRCRYPDGTRHQLPDDGFVRLSASSGFAHEIAAVPTGVTCSITEADDHHATWYGESPPIVVTMGTINLLEATTRFDLATMHVSTIAYGDFPAATAFGYATTCLWPDPELIIPIQVNDPADAAFDLRSGQSRDIQVLMNSFCTVVETDTAGAVRVVVAATGPRTTLVPDGADAELFAPGEVTFAFANYMQGSLPVTGAEIQWGILLVAGALIALGATLLAVRNRRTTRHR